MAYHFDTIKLDKGMYQETGMTFTQVLEKADPSENYKNTPYEGLDAYQRQLKRFGIKVKGAGSDRVEKFFTTSQAAVLFPEYVSRSVKTGMVESNILPALTASTTKVDSLDYRSIYSVSNEELNRPTRLEEGTVIPTTEIALQENYVRLHKRGRMLVASYEAVRFQRLDLFSVMLREIGNQIMRAHLEDAIEVLLNGDGNGNEAEIVTMATGESLSYNTLLDFWSRFDPYTMNTILVSPGTMLALLKLPEFQNPLTGLNFQGTGELTNPLGAKLIKTAAMADNKILGLDKNYALEMVQASDLNVEYDRLIDRQLERAAITSITGFAKIYAGASKVLETA